MLERLAKGPVTIVKLAEPHDVSLNAVSKHVKTLEGAGLVRRDRDRNYHWIGLDREGLRPAVDWMEHHTALWRGSLDALKRHVGEHVKRLEIFDSVRIERPASDVFRAWSSASALAQWFAPMAVRPIEVEMDFRTGGSFRLEMDTGAGGVHVTTGEYLRIVPDERIEMTWHCDAWDDLPSHVEVAFESDGDATTVMVRHSSITSDPALEGQAFGWQACLSQLHTWLSQP